MISKIYKTKKIKSITTYITLMMLII